MTVNWELRQSGLGNHDHVTQQIVSELTGLPFLHNADGDNVLSIDEDGNLIVDLPTSDPGVAGALWVDSGTVKVSAGS